MLVKSRAVSNESGKETPTEAHATTNKPQPSSPDTKEKSRATRSTMNQSSRHSAVHEEGPKTISPYEEKLRVLRNNQTGTWSSRLLLYMDREAVLDAVSRDGCALAFASRDLRADREVALAAVSKDGMALRYAADKSKADRDILLAAVSQDGMALQFAAKELMLDRDLVLTAVAKDERALEYAADELKEHRDFVLAAVSLAGGTLWYAAQAFSADREIVLAAVSQNGYALRCAADEFQADREIVLAAVSQCGFVLRDASEELKADRRVVMVAVNQHRGRALRFASTELQKDPAFVWAAQVQEDAYLRRLQDAPKSTIVDTSEKSGTTTVSAHTVPSSSDGDDIDPRSPVNYGRSNLLTPPSESQESSVKGTHEDGPEEPLALRPDHDAGIVKTRGSVDKAVKDESPDVNTETNAQRVLSSGRTFSCV